MDASTHNLVDRVQASYLLLKLQTEKLIDADEARGGLALLLPDVLPELASERTSAG